MQQHEIQRYLERFFTANHCEILRNEDGLFQTKLTVELDKLLMNRPFYWHYIEKTGGVPETMTLTFKTKKNDKEPGEFIHVGSPRLHQIFQTAKKMASFLRLYEQIENKNTEYIPLVPWLVLNMKISYICDLKKDVLHSIGLQLITGQMCTNAIERIKTVKLSPKLPDFTFPLTPLIQPKSGLKRIKNYIYDMLEKENDNWAQQAIERWNKDLALLERFYENKEKNEAYYNEKEALRRQYEPKIKVEIINGGIFYLSKQFQFS